MRLKFSHAVIMAIFLFSGDMALSLELRDVIPKDQIQAIDTIKNYMQKGTIMMGGLEGTAEYAFSSPDKYLATFDLGKLRISQGFDGKTAWMIDQNNQAMEISGSDRRSVINSLYIAGQSYLFENKYPGKVKFWSDSEINGIKYFIFKAYPDGGDSIILHLNSVTRCIDIVQEYKDELSINTYLEDYRSLNGYMIPYILRTETSIPQLNSIFTLEKMEVNILLDGHIFEMPQQSRLDYSSITDADSVIVPIELINGHIFVLAKINGSKPAYFMLDSGAGMNVINRNFAEKLGISLEGDFAAKGVAGYGSAAMSYVDSIEIGGVRLYSQNIAVVDISNLGIAVHGEFGGILGFDLLSRFPIRISYNDSQATFYNANRFIAPNDSNAISLDFLMKIPVIDAELNGYKGRFAIDLGNSLGLILHSSFVDKYNISREFTDIKEMKVSLGGVGGQTEAYAAMANAFTIGWFIIKAPPLLVAGGNKGLINSEELDGNIGNLMLKKFDLVFNYATNKLYLFPRTSSINRLSESNKP